MLLSMYTSNQTDTAALSGATKEGIEQEQEQAQARAQGPSDSTRESVKAKKDLQDALAKNHAWEAVCKLL